MIWRFFYSNGSNWLLLSEVSGREIQGIRHRTWKFPGKEIVMFDKNKREVWNRVRSSQCSERPKQTREVLWPSQETKDHLIFLVFVFGESPFLLRGLSWSNSLIFTFHDFLLSFAMTSILSNDYNHHFIAWIWWWIPNRILPSTESKPIFLRRRWGANLYKADPVFFFCSLLQWLWNPNPASDLSCNHVTDYVGGLCCHRC